jgi:hypothetical protein
MKRSLARVAVLAAAAIVATAVLSGCAPAAHASKGHSRDVNSTPDATTTPTPISPGPLPANALFRITAKAIQPNGATVDLVQTVFAPTAPTASDTALLDAQCNDSGSPSWQSQYPGGVLYVDTTITATLDTTTPAFNTNATIAASFGFGASAFSGDYVVAQANCAPGFIAIPGAVHGVDAVPASDTAHGTFGWADPDTTYGFFGDANDPSDPNGGNGSTIVKDCAVEISAAALAAAPSLASWASQPYVQSKSCYYQP